jgi:hypothetical protein
VIVLQGVFRSVALDLKAFIRISMIGTCKVEEQHSKELRTRAIVCKINQGIWTGQCIGAASMRPIDYSVCLRARRGGRQSTDHGSARTVHPTVQAAQVHKLVDEHDIEHC